MRSNTFKSVLIKSGLVASALLLASGVSFAQEVTLTAARTTTTLPDGSTVPMWGYSCSAAAVAPATCAASNPAAAGNWSPVLITAPPGALTIHLTNSLPAAVPETSLVIVGQLGAGLGDVSQRTTSASPTHATQVVTWAIAGDSSGATNTPPPQGARVQSFSTPVAPGQTVNLTWSALKPGTYLIESGTHPSIQGPMGLYGILVVTTAPAGSTPGTAYPAAGSIAAVTYNAEIPVLLSEIDPVQNSAVDAAVATAGFSETSARVLRDSVSSVTVNADPVTGVPLAGSGYTVGDIVVISGGGFTTQATAHVSQLVGSNTQGLSTTGIAAVTIDNPGAGYTGVPSPVNVTSSGSGASLSANLSLGGVVCSNGAAACYPPAVNYTPLYYLVNGVAFNDKSTAASATNSLFSTLPSTATTPITGSVLVRFVNAGLRMHVPSIVGSLTTPAIVPTGVTAVQTPGFSLVAEDGNPLPGVSRVQSEVFLAAGKTYDVKIDVPTDGGALNALPVYDRELSLSANSVARDAGMLAYLSINGAVLPAAATAAFTAVKANPDTYNSVLTGQTLMVSDPGKGVLANDINVTGVQVVGAAPAGLTLHPDGTFVYTAGTPTSFTYCGNGATSGPACATVTLGAAPTEASASITCTVPSSTYTSNSTSLSIKPPGILSFCKDAAGYPLTVAGATSTTALSLGLSPSGTVTVDQNGGFNASVAAAGTYTFTFKPQNSQGTVAAGAASTVTLIFPAATGLTVNVVDGTDKVTPVTDYRWIIEEDRTFYINPACTANPPPAGCPTSGTGIVPTFGTNFHTSYMPVVAAGCTGPLSCESGQTVLGTPAVCDIGNGVCRTTSAQQAAMLPSAVHLDPTKRYYISILPGDAGNSFENTGGCLSNPTPSCGHGMGGAPIVCTPASGTVVCTATTGAFPAALTVYVQPNPFPPSKLSVFVFEDDYPLNGEQDGGGGVGVVSPNEPGLGGFNITLFDDAGGTGDSTGQMTYDMFNMPLSNGLAGTIDPATGLDACPVSGANQNLGWDGTVSPTGITGTIVTCPKFEKDGVTLSPLAGQAVISNLMPGRYGVVATPGADRIARGEEWLQTNTLDGQKAHDSFLRIGEPSYFQEYGPAGFHVSIGFANPQIINARRPYICNGTDPNAPNYGTGVPCLNGVTGTVTMERMSRTPDERLYSSGDNSGFAFTQCYVSFGDPDGEDFAFTKCDANGNFSLAGLPDGDWRVTVFDQWNDMLVDGLSTPVRLGGGAVTNLGQIATNQWQINMYTSTFFDANGNGVRDSDEQGLTLVATNNRYRDGSYSNFNSTDLAGNAGFNEIFPLFSWYVIETDTTRYKSTGMHVVYDAGGPSDGTTCGGTTGTVCGNSNIAHFLANTAEQIPLPNPATKSLRVPGAFYCATADCADAPSPLAPGGAGGSTGRVDPPFWFGTEGWQGFSGQNEFIEFGKKPYAVGETGGIHGEVIYASTRPFDDPTLLIHTSWTPDVPGVTINLYKESTAPDGSTALTLIDTTKTSSWDDWAQGFRSDGVPNMNCPGQGTNTGTNADLFFFSIFNQPNWLDQYNHGIASVTPLPNNSQFKCYDGMHNWNQIQPAPYDGMYQFPSVTAFNPSTGRPAGTNCTACVPNPDTTDPYRVGTPMLPAGKYVVEMVVPPGYELVKEEDKNILIGDNYIAPVTQQFAGLGNVFILPDQAEVSAYANGNNVQNPTNTLGRTTLPSHEGDTGSVETFWPCVGAARVVPDYISLFPQSGEVAPFAGATRNLCDRKEITLTDQSSALAKFWVFSSTHVAAHFTGVITDDYTSEFDPFSPQFGEKFSPPDLPISIKDWTGTEIARTYADHWGTYNGLTYSTWEVNPPNPTGYAPTMMVTCMNDPGTGAVPDPLFNPQYSQFCYEIPFMPGQTQYMDTPVVPTSAFAGAGYNNPDCAYPALTPAIAEVDSTDGVGPWVNATASVASVTISAGGSYATVPTVSFSPPPAGTTATGTALMGVSIVCNNCTFASTGNRYTAGAPTVTIAAPGCTVNGTTCIAASATVTMTGTGGARHVGSVNVNSGMGYTTVPAVTISCTGTCVQVTGRALNVTTSLKVNVVSLTSGGTGYTTPPTVTFSGGGGTGGAAATAVLSAPIVPATTALTITALGDQLVPNNAYTGPSATTAPYNQKKVLRHYGFGATQGTGSVTIGGITAPVVAGGWSDSKIVVSIPSGVPLCPIQQQAQYGGSSNMECGQLVVTTGTGQQSIDTVTVTIGGKAPTHVAASASIQAAIDAAMPGDMIIIDPTCSPTGGGAAVACSTSALHATSATQLATQAAHQEMVLMWKPIRLQGVGAASSIINANTHPSGDLKLTPWRKQVNCLFGLGVDGSPNTWNASCGAGWTAFKAATNQPQVDRLPLEAVVGWDATLNGNLAELLQEPSLMGALEGAGITVLGKGLNFHGQNPWDPTLEAGFPAATTLLTASTNTSNCGPNAATAVNPFPSNFQCNPSSIDGLGIQNSSQGGGGIFVHGWAHNLQIANNRVNNNAGTLSGGINLGQGEFSPAILGGAAAINAAPGSCASSGTANLQLPYCNNLNVNIHHNSVTSNSSTGDELFSATPAGAGGVSICTGADFYKFNYNWVCGNLSTGDGGGVAQIGLSYGGDIEHNVIVFNQSTNPTIPTNAGGLLIMGAPDADPVCGNSVDIDCLPAPGTVSPSDGVGPGLVINANLIMGNQAESGSGGGLALQNVNGSDVVNFPNGGSTVTFPSGALFPGGATFPGGTGTMSPWYGPVVTNNIIVNNVSGWDGGGVSMIDALNVNFINNTVMSNDSTASSGVLFNTIGQPLASTQGANCIQSGTTTASCPQVGGLVSIQNSASLVANLPTSITCPANHGAQGTGNSGSLVNGACRKISFPELYNNVFWQNRSFYIGVGPLGGNTLNQQNVVALYNAFGPQTTANLAASQPSTGACVAASYWDIGVRGDSGPTNHATGVPPGPGLTLNPEASVLTSTAGYAGGGTGFRANSASNPAVVHQYCNGSRIPPEAGGTGWQVPPGISDATVPNPVFNLTPAATVDEGNNWINISWGPLSMRNPTDTATLGNYAPTSASPVINYITAANSATTYAAAPALDFFNNPRKSNNAVDVGAVEFVATGPAVLTVAPSPLAFGSVPVGQSRTLQLTLTNSGGAAATGITVGAYPAGFAAAAGGTCGATLAGGTACTINVAFSPTAVQAYSAPLTITASVAVAGAPVTLSGTGITAVRTATVSPSSLNFGTQAAGTNSGRQPVTVTNTGNVALAGGTFTITAGPFHRTGGAAGGTCGATLAVGANCTYYVTFSPATGAVSGTAYTRTLSVAYTGATVTGIPVSLQGSVQ